MARAIIAISEHPELEPIVLNEASHEIGQQYLSSEKAHRVLGWQAQYSVEAGLRKTLTWYKEFFKHNA
jgi:CDP-glucose 4,6-dehydratase